MWRLMVVLLALLVTTTMAHGGRSRSLPISRYRLSSAEEPPEPYDDL